MTLACCHDPPNIISCYCLLCLEIPFHFPAAYGQQSSCATLSCVTTVQLPNQLGQTGKQGPEYGAAALANILLSSGTEQTVTGYGANLLQEWIFNIPLLQESLEAAREPHAERCEDNNGSLRSALLRNPVTGQKRQQATSSGAQAMGAAGTGGSSGAKRTGCRHCLAAGSGVTPMPGWCLGGPGK